MKRLLLVSFSFLFFNITNAQPKKDSVRCTGMQVVTTRTTIEGYPFDKFLKLSKESLKSGFKLISSDGNWKIDGFIYYWDCEGCDIYFKQVVGNTVNTEEHFIFKKLKKGEVLDFTCINLERSGIRYLAQGFSVLITD